MGRLWSWRRRPSRQRSKLVRRRGQPVATPETDPKPVPRWAWFALIFGLFLTLARLSFLRRRSGVPAAAPSPRPGPEALRDRPVRPGVRHLQPAPGLFDAPRLVEPASRPGSSPARALRLDPARDEPGRRPPGSGGLARTGEPGRAGRPDPGAGGQGGQYRHEPPVRGDASRSPDRVCARLAGDGIGGRGPEAGRLDGGDLPRAGDAGPPVGRAATGPDARGELGRLGDSAGFVRGELATIDSGDWGPRSGAGPRAGVDGRPGRTTLRRIASRGVPAPGRDGARAAAHAAFDLADAPMAGLGLLSVAGPPGISRDAS